MSCGSLDGTSVSLMSGYCDMKLPSRGTIHKSSSAGTQETESVPALAGLVMRWVAAAMPSKAVDTAGKSSAPCGVSFTRCPARSNSLTPSDCSSALIWWLMAPWVTLSSVAALVSEAWRAVASKARSGFNGGRRLAIGTR